MWKAPVPETVCVEAICTDHKHGSGIRKDKKSISLGRPTRFDDNAADSSPKITFAAASRNSGLPVVISYYMEEQVINQRPIVEINKLDVTHIVPKISFRYILFRLGRVSQSKTCHDNEEVCLLYLCHGLQFMIPTVLVPVDANAEVDFSWVQVVVSPCLEMIHDIGRPARNIVEEHLVGWTLSLKASSRNREGTRMETLTLYSSASSEGQNDRTSIRSSEWEARMGIEAKFRLSSD
jgi:hypothetical protein